MSYSIAFGFLPVVIACYTLYKSIVLYREVSEFFDDKCPAERLFLQRGAFLRYNHSVLFLTVAYLVFQASWILSKLDGASTESDAVYWTLFEIALFLHFSTSLENGVSVIRSREKMFELNADECKCVQLGLEIGPCHRNCKGNEDKT